MLWFLVVVGIAVVALKGFDRIAGRSQTRAAQKFKEAGVGERLDPSGEISRLAALRDKGDLTPEEFQEQKRRLLR